MPEADLIDYTAPALCEEFTVLCVDDEANILASLRRLLRRSGYQIITAESGAAALVILGQEKIDLIISDMRMPEMNGAEFLSIALNYWPNIPRILLTGYADIHSTIDAINKARISRYISKPWDDQEMLGIVEEALTVKRLERDKNQLNSLIGEQNKKLQELNQSLEAQVKARTYELEAAISELHAMHEKLKKGFVTSVRVFANLIEMRANNLSGHARVIADLSRKVARQLSLTEAEIQDTFIAALLHSIGKIGLPDSLLAKPFVEMTLQERNIYANYPGKGHAALMALEQLQGASAIIRSQHERYDGLGYPDKLVAAEIPIGARILGLCSDYESLQAGFLTGKPMLQSEAIKNIESSSGKRYDPRVVEAFLSVIARPEYSHEQLIRSKDLKPQMVLARDLLASGVMLLAKDHVLDERLIRQICAFEKSDHSALEIYIQVK
ncbi:HD domain-containing phosphohydrolase [Iodobacter violaceini]|uniref:HD domain-containing phosphohydrolase n=1 Tax=Iodobacter violaceini TaxID=3044271 RepID=UPI00197B117A|nr:HD domain-containing phosphohydrolase [Iodobacter violacea]